MATRLARSIVPVALIVALAVLPVLFILFGFTLTPFMAVTAWADSVWPTVAAVAVVCFVIWLVMRTRKPV